ncbi:hypothetical protein CEXT_606991 [Caerostris extrusa]|uniref:Uncharacterized protein n=1 Tax=Caerostris extrusa TaxID=172846 RepID=A0AAV4RMF6_CAEEX|nr:hypothetical protein CEXT_606991 [Caerostris extrusa]
MLIPREGRDISGTFPSRPFRSPHPSRSFDKEIIQDSYSSLVLRDICRGLFCVGIPARTVRALQLVASFRRCCVSCFKCERHLTLKLHTWT